MRVAYLQTAPKFLRVEHNLDRAEQQLKGLRADLIVLPEFFNSGYNFQNAGEIAAVAEPLDGPTVRRLRKIARAKGAALVAGFPEKSGGKFYNSAVFVTPQAVQVYRKVHLFSGEKKFFSPGNLGFRVFPWKGARIGVMVCFDWFFPEAARTLALKGADLIAHPANLVLPYCPEAMRTRCLENRVFAVTCNRVGRERGLRYIGQSQIVDPWGKILSRASGTLEASAAVSVDLRLARSKRLNAANDLFSDRRPSVYA
jgi:predicted amidohydrolase